MIWRCMLIYKKTKKNQTISPQPCSHIPKGESTGADSVGPPLPRERGVAPKASSSSPSSTPKDWVSTHKINKRNNMYLLKAQLIQVCHRRLLRPGKESLQSLCINKRMVFNMN